MSSIFLDKTLPPNDRELSRTLGPAFKKWIEIKASLTASYGPVVEEWKYYGAKSGWVLKTLLKKRNLFFMAPGKKLFAVAFVFGDRAVDAIEQSGLPAPMIEQVKNAKRYAEGRGLRIEIRGSASVKHVLTLVAIKVAN